MLPLPLHHRQYHQLEGREAELRRFIETEYQAALQRHAGRAVDERAETHLQVAALALASHKALLPYLRNEGEVLQVSRLAGWSAGKQAAGRFCLLPLLLPPQLPLTPTCAASHPRRRRNRRRRRFPPPPLPSPQIIQEHMGGRTAALLRFLLAVTKFLQRDGYAALTARLRGLQWDMGAGFASQLQLGDSEVRQSWVACRRRAANSVWAGQLGCAKAWAALSTSWSLPACARQPCNSRPATCNPC